MHLIDGHLDLAYLALNGRDLQAPIDDAATGCVSFPALHQGGVRAVFATIFTEPSNAAAADLKPEMYPVDDVDAAEAAGLRQLAVYDRWEQLQQVAIVRNSVVLRDGDDRLNLVLLMEGADPIRSPEHVQAWRDRGVRIVGLTWAAGTRYAGGNGPPPAKAKPNFYRTGELTSLGIEMIHALDAAGIIHDVSHLSDAAFDGLMQHARGPVIASHSNCRSLVEPWQRHLRDDQIKAIVDRGGVIGLNLFTSFLVKGRRATLDDCIAHIERVCEIAGHRRGVALGSDADGGFGKADLPLDLDHPSKWRELMAGLASRGWSQQDVNAFAHENWERILHSQLQ